MLIKAMFFQNQDTLTPVKEKESVPSSAKTDTLVKEKNKSKSQKSIADPASGDTGKSKAKKEKAVKPASEEKKEIETQVEKDTSATINTSQPDKILTVQAIDTSAIDTVAITSTADFIDGMFTGHQLKPVNKEPILKAKLNEDWFLGILLFVFILLAIIKVFYNKRFRQLLDGFFVSRYASQAVREENVLLQRVSVILFLSFVLTTAAFIYKLSEYYGWRIKALSDLSLYLIIAAIIFLVYVFKLITVKIMGYIFKTEKEVEEYSFNILLFNNVLGLALFPVVLCMAFVTELPVLVYIQIAAGMFAVVFLYRIVRGFILGAGTAGISKLYLFLYLCTLEFLPLVVIIKLFISGF